jgi:hypothetical protein
MLAKTPQIILKSQLLAMKKEPGLTTMTTGAAKMELQLLYRQCSQVAKYMTAFTVSKMHEL